MLRRGFKAALAARWHSRVRYSTGMSVGSHHVISVSSQLRIPRLWHPGVAWGFRRLLSHSRVPLASACTTFPHRGAATSHFPPLRRYTLDAPCSALAASTPQSPTVSLQEYSKKATKKTLKKATRKSTKADPCNPAFRAALIPSLPDLEGKLPVNHNHGEIDSVAQTKFSKQSKARKSGAQAEHALELFVEYYRTIGGKPGPVGFDTETTTGFVPRTGSGVSLIQIATQDVCLMFQIYRITSNNKAPDLFPPRLKAFLEDPEQLLVGVAAAGDARDLRQSYNVHCAGVVNLEVMAKERRILARSLADLDAMFGRPGREIIKTKALLGWNWDRNVLDSRWVWYAAKDAFAGLAIFENMLHNKTKEGYLPYEQRHPMSESELAADIYLFLTRSIGDKELTVGMIESTIAASYPRFRKVYQPEDRTEHAKRLVGILLRDGRINSTRNGDPVPLTSKDEVFKIGKPLSSLLVTSRGLDIIRPFFNAACLDLDTLPAKGTSLPEIRNPAEESDQDVMDLRLFLELAWVWDKPRTSEAVVAIYATVKADARAKKDRTWSRSSDYERTSRQASSSIGTPDESEVSRFIDGFLDRLRSRGLLLLQQHTWEVALALRDVLIRLEDTIIFALIERAQFAVNECTYQEGVYEYDDGYKGSFLGYFLHEMEIVHARVRRYTSPDEYPFTSPLPPPILPSLDFPPILHKNDINVNNDIMDRYLQDIVPRICSPGDDSNYGTSATRDVECLQALSRRIHYGKFIAEAKFSDPAEQSTYIRLIKAKDREGLMELLTNRTVEAALLRRLRRKAMIYGHDITENGELILDQSPEQRLQSQKIHADVVVELYERFVIPLTKEVEVRYLLQRLDERDQ
ncbi:chorismate mutase aro7 [Dissophora globulifera]|uniref:Chorismate mutase n=1 Tax=Dissophora globulifera TaxID=979702 RepID=A0A9P6RIV7_9FUNG|nr:chorismate mutase aro7 [Dissophora globulifera]